MFAILINSLTSNFEPMDMGFTTSHVVAFDPWTGFFAKYSHDLKFGQLRFIGKGYNQGSLAVDEAGKIWTILEGKVVSQPGTKALKLIENQDYQYSFSSSGRYLAKIQSDYRGAEVYTGLEYKTKTERVKNFVTILDVGRHSVAWLYTDARKEPSGRIVKPALAYLKMVGSSAKSIEFSGNWTPALSRKMHRLNSDSLLVCTTDELMVFSVPELRLTKKVKMPSLGSLSVWSMAAGTMKGTDISFVLLWPDRYELWRWAKSGTKKIHSAKFPFPQSTFRYPLAQFRTSTEFYIVGSHGIGRIKTSPKITESWTKY